MRDDTAVRTYSRTIDHACERARARGRPKVVDRSCPGRHGEFLPADGGDDHQKQDGQQPTQNVPPEHAHVFSPTRPPLCVY